MLTIIAFINFIGTIFACVLCIYSFCLADDLEYKPEKITELAENLSNYFPLELTVLTFIFSTAVYYGNVLQIIFIIPLLAYNFYL